MYKITNVSKHVVVGLKPGASAKRESISSEDIKLANKKGFLVITKEEKSNTTTAKN